MEPDLAQCPAESGVPLRVHDPPIARRRRRWQKLRIHIRNLSRDRWSQFDCSTRSYSSQGSLSWAVRGNRVEIQIPFRPRDWRRAARLPRCSGPQKGTRRLCRGRWSKTDRSVTSYSTRCKRPVCEQQQDCSGGPFSGTTYHWRGN